ncbi:MAG: PQQ-dependent catabolism-associated beta-propeller protein, partial [Noviherbaspirillum sp.]
MTFRQTMLAAVMALAFVLPAAARQSGQVFVSSEKDNTVAVLDGKTHRQQALIKTCKRPRHMQLTPDASRLLVACGDDGRADVIDIARLAVVDRLKLQEGAEIFDLSPDGKTLYFSNEDDGLLSAVDLITKKTVANIKVGEEPEGVKVGPDGKTVYVTSE